MNDRAPVSRVFSRRALDGMPWNRSSVAHGTSPTLTPLGRSLAFLTLWRREPPIRGPIIRARHGPSQALGPVTDQPVSFQGAGAGDAVRLQEVDHRCRHDVFVVGSNFGTERNNQIIQGG